MGGVASFVADPSFRKLGSGLFDPLGIGYGDAVHGVKDEDDDDSAPQQSTTTTTATHAPDAAKVDASKSLLQQQSDARRKRLLFQSTGRPPQGPTISSQPTTPTQQRTTLF